MSSRITVIAILTTGFLVMAGVASAQQFLSMTDQRWVDLALDHIRKGIQQEDTAKIMAPFADQIVVTGKSQQTKATMSAQFGTLFRQTAGRQMVLTKPSFPRSDSPYRQSSFWDFDIINSKTVFRGDTAFVDCELVFWGTSANPPNGRHGRRVTERFVFVAPPIVKDVPAGEEYGTFDPPPKATARVWHLAGFDRLLEFLETEGATNSGSNTGTTGGKR